MGYYHRPWRRWATLTAEQKKQRRLEQFEKHNLTTKILDNKNNALLNIKNNDREISELCKDVLKGKVKKSKKDTFVFITKEEMEATLLPGGFTRRVIENGYCKQLMYERGIKGIDDIKLVIFSTVDDTDISRAKGKDAIQVRLFHERANDVSFPLGRFGSVYRMEGWQERLKKKINEVYIIGKNLQRCAQCGYPLVERKVKVGPRRGEKFMACSGYPNCKGKPKTNTRKLHTIEQVSLTPPF